MRSSTGGTRPSTAWPPPSGPATSARRTPSPTASARGPSGSTAMMSSTPPPPSAGSSGAASAANWARSRSTATPSSRPSRSRLLDNDGLTSYRISRRGAFRAPRQRAGCDGHQKGNSYDEIPCAEVLMKRALLVIDVQNEYFTGILPITHPVGHLGKILEVMDASAGRVPTVVIQHQTLQEDKPFFQKGKPGWELHPEVAGRPRDLRIEKTLPGSFTGTGLESWLREQGIDTVTIAGYMTHMCCDTTARQAVHRGFAVEFLSDATGTLPLANSAGSVTAEELHRSILCAQQMMLSEVLPSSAWIERIRASTTSP